MDADPGERCGRHFRWRSWGKNWEAMFEGVWEGGIRVWVEGWSERGGGGTSIARAWREWVHMWM